VTLTSPTNGAIFNSPAAVPITASVTSNGWLVSDVEFFSNGSLIGQDSSAPYAFTWSSVSSGAYTLKARALFDGGSSTVTSAPVNITVTPAPVFTGVKINFQPAVVPVPAGYLVDSGQVFADRGNGFSYGWNQDNSGNMIDRNSPSSPDQRYDTFAATQTASGGSVWEISVPGGDYSVLLVAGDPTRFNSTYRFDVEGELSLSGTPTTQSRWISGSNTVTVADGRLTVSNSGGASNNKLCFIEITPVVLRLRWVGRDAAGIITLRLEGSNGRTFEIEGSNDFFNWRPVVAAQNADGTFSFTDNEAGVQVQRFYRAKLIP
jgi:hypothetical protein